MQFLAIFAAVATFLYLTSKLLLKFIIVPIEERPEIRVRNGKLTIKNTKKNWKRLSSDREWKHDDPDGKPVTAFKVKATGSITCSRERGTDVLVSFEADNVVYEIHVPDPSKRNEVVVISNVDLEHVVWARKLKIKGDPDGRITNISVDGNPCPPPAGGKVELTLKFIH